MKYLKWILVLIGIAGLVSVRILEDKMFYDPFLEYFKRSKSNFPFPEFNWSQLILSHLFRFVLNLFFSAVIIHFIFLSKKWTFQAIIIMVIIFAVTFPIYLYCVSEKFVIGALFSFYMRRFVIQPLILLLIVPAFFYRKKLS